MSTDSLHAVRTASAAARLPAEARAALDRALRALDAAQLRHDAAQMSQSLADVGRAHRQLANTEAAEWYMQQALRWANTLGAADTSIDLLCELSEMAVAIAEKGNTDDSGSARVAHDRARDCAFEAARLASQCADAQWEITVLLRVSDTLDRCGDHDDAIALQCRALQLIADENLDPAAAANRRVRPS